MRWAFHENLCLASDRGDLAFHVFYDPDAVPADLALVRRRYEVVATDAEVLGLAVVCALDDATLCCLIGDEWDVREDEGDVVRADWALHFGVTGLVSSCEVVTDPVRWRWLCLRQQRRPSPLDFVLGRG